LIVGIIANESIAKFVTKATKGLSNTIQSTTLATAPNRQNRSVLSLSPPSPYLIDRIAIVNGPKNSMYGTQTVLLAPENL